MLRGDSDAVEDMKSEYRVDDKRVIMSKIKVLIDQNKYEDLLTFIERHQKKYKIPV
jgi:predicted acetyltransferase